MMVMVGFHWQLDQLWDHLGDTSAGVWVFPERIA